MTGLMHDAPAAVMNRLSQIEDDLAERQNAYEDAADELARATRAFNLRFAQAMVVAQGGSEKTREAQALIAVAAAEDGVYERLTNAEAAYKALKAAIGTMESRATIGQSILRAQGRS